MMGLKYAIVTVEAACNAMVSEKRSKVNPNKKLTPKNTALFSFMGYQYRNKI
ncbi:MAG: hypothetical protein WBG90_19560 [Saonia sp.]